MMILISWVLLVSFIVFNGQFFSKNFKLFILVYFWVPGLIALYFAKKEKLKIPIFKRWRYSFLLAFISSITLAMVVAFFSLPFCQMRSSSSLKILLPSFLHGFAPSHMFLLFVLIWVGMGIFLVTTIQLFPLLGHELMFLGYAWEKMKFLGFWRASWVIGLYLGLWLSPLALLGLGYPGAPIWGIFCLIIHSILLTPIKVYLRLASKAILCPTLFFGLLLHFSNIFPYLFEIKNHIFFGVLGGAGIVALLFINLILFLKTRKTPLLEYEL